MIIIEPRALQYQNIKINVLLLSYFIPHLKRASQQFFEIIHNTNFQGHLKEIMNFYIIPERKRKEKSNSQLINDQSAWKTSSAHIFFTLRMPLKMLLQHIPAQPNPNLYNLFFESICEVSIVNDANSIVNCKSSPPQPIAHTYTKA